MTSRLQQFYWQNSRPALILAIVTLGLTIWSVYVVHPNLSNKLTAVCEQNLEVLELSKGISDDGYFPSQPVVNQEGHVEYHHYLGILNETRICLQRLYYSDMSNLPVAYQLATVYRAIADLKLAEARDISQRKNSLGSKANVTGVANGKPQAQENRLLHEATDSLRKMDEVLRRIERYEGKGTLHAKLQLLNRQIDKSNYLSPAELQTLFEQCKADYLLLSMDKDASQTTRSNAKDLLRRLGLRITFSASATNSVQERLKLANELRDLDEGTPPASISSLRLASESISLFDEAKCTYYASQLAQKYWDRRPSSSTSPSMIDAMFYSLTVQGNIEEAKGFLASHLKKLPKHDEYKLREACTETCIRRTICSLLWEPSTAGKVPVNHSELLNLAIVLSPESEELLHLFEGMASSESDENVLMRLRNSLDQSGSVSMRELIELVKCASSGSIDRMEKVLQALAKEGVHFSVFASSLANRLERSKVIETDVAIQWLATINQSAPMVHAAWFHRASMLSKQEKYTSALECLQHLKKELPSNDQIDHFILELKSKIDPKDSLPVQSP